MGSNGRTRSAQALAQLDTFLAHTFLYFDFYFLNGVQNSIALHAQIYLITDSVGGWQD
jgi:hypothetical protein